MTFDTWDSYNTDEAYKDKGTTAKGLVAAYKKDNPNGTAEDFYSKLNKTWAQDKDGYVKKAVDEAFTVETPKEEKKEEVKETVKETPKTEKATPVSDNRTQQYLNKQDEIAKNAKETALNDIKKDSASNWEELYNTQIRRAEANQNIDDHFIDQLPTFMLKRYTNGEFGDPKSKDAKLRLSYFLLNGVQNKLRQASNLAMANAGKSPQFADTTSEYEKYQNTNLQQGLENRWTKYKADTDAAIKLANKEADNEQDARISVEQLTRDKQANTRWNIMDQNQKLYSIEISREIGKLVGDMDISQLGNFITGAVMNGTMDKDQIVAVGIAKLVQSTPKLIELLLEGNIKNMVLSMVGGDASDVIAGFGGVGGSNNNGNGSSSLTGNLQGYKTIDGNELSFDFADARAGEKIQPVFDDLIERYKKGEIDEATFKQYYDPLYSEAKKHPLSKTIFAKDSDSAIKKANGELLSDLNESFNELNKNAKAGNISVSDYDEQFDNILANAKKYGADKKQIEYIQKNKVSQEKILKAAEKKNKKK